MCLYTQTIKILLGVYLSLERKVYANNSDIPITEIDTRLQCITDKMPCCAAFNDKTGDWFFPGGTAVPGPLQSPTSFYRTRGDDGTVNLNRLNTSVLTPTGLFCCVVPDATGDMQRVCANIGIV